MGRSRYKIFDTAYPYFVTSTVVNWLPLFGSPPVVRILLDSLQFLQNQDRLTVYAYVIMENHLHLVAASERLSKDISSFRSYTARQIIDFFKTRQAENVLNQLAYYKLRHRQDRDYQLWQEGVHPQQIQSREMMTQKIEYIHHNPLKRGYVDDPTHWRYSSARNYAGQVGLLEVDTDW